MMIVSVSAQTINFSWPIDLKQLPVWSRIAERRHSRCSFGEFQIDFEPTQAARLGT